MDALLGADFVLGEGEVFYPPVLEGLLLLNNAEIVSYLLLVPGRRLYFLKVVEIIGWVSRE